jgi:SAM-dependent methyltransferase
MAEIDKVADLYRAAFGKHGRSSAAVLCPKGRHDLRFAALTAPFDLSGKRILDFGCGLGHLCTFFRERGIICDYVGVDIVDEFVVSNRKAFPDLEFRTIENIDEISGEFDIVIASGVFNLHYMDDPAVNEVYVRNSIRKLFGLCREGLSMDFMTSHVDFQQDNAFHVDPAEILTFAIEHLGRRAIVNHSYMPFEFCLNVFKRDAIEPTVGVYGR